MTLKELIAQVRARLAAKLEERAAQRRIITEVRSACAAETDRDPTDAEATAVRAAEAEVVRIDAEVTILQARVAELEAEQAADEAAERLAAECTPTGSAPPASDRTSTTRVTSEPRTYARETDPKGKRFLSDVAGHSIFGNFGARERLERHMNEERVERGTDAFDTRAVGTAAFSGLVVPQYLVDLFAPAAKAGRPFADACRSHDLPAEGMVVNIGKVTTSTSTDLQASQGDAVDETDIDDSLVSPVVQTNAGQQTISRQAIERGAGIEDTTLEDLFRSYAVTLDSTLLNQAVNGLSAVSTAITYTDAAPTAAALYPKLLQAPAAVEAALLDQAAGDTLAVMHSRRWYWLQSQLTSTWPMFGQPGLGAQQGGVNYGERYGSGFRGVLPNGTPVIVDNNVTTAAGTNEDEVYFGAQSELHLWEDASAPVLIRAEQTKAANLQVLFVVYGYFAYTFARRAHAQKIGGTGLITPTF